MDQLAGKIFTTSIILMYDAVNFFNKRLIFHLIQKIYVIIIYFIDLIYHKIFFKHGISIFIFA